MALIKCDECGKQISDRASACPGCGAPVKPPDNNYYILRGATEQGPYSLEDLAGMLERGEINVDTHYCQPGMASWEKIAGIVDLINAAKKEAQSSTIKKQSSESQSGRKCPYCAGEIPKEAVKCKHCGSSIKIATGAGVTDPLTGGVDPLMAAVASGCCLAGLGQMMMGQAGKGLVLMLVCVVLAVITAGISIILTWPLMGIDAYMVAKRIKEGKPVGPWEFFPS